MKIIVPLAGKDPRYETINVYKPFIDIHGKPLIHHVLSANQFPFENMHFIILNEHEEKYQVTKHLKNHFGSDAMVYIIEKETEGSPETILQIENVVNGDEDILIELGDVVRDLLDFEKDIKKNSQYAGILPIDPEFTAEKWGYVKRKGTEVLEMCEKSLEVIIGGATMGLYYFKHGKDFVRYAKQMINKQIKIPPLELYYVAPIYNEYINDKKKVGISNAKILSVLGSPEQIDAYLNAMQYNR